MLDREEFEKYWSSKYDIPKPDFTIEYGKYRDAWMQTNYEFWQEQQKKIDTLNALNPDVPCPACGGKYKHITNADFDLSGGCEVEITECGFCIRGTVPLTKAQEYRIKQLEAENHLLEDDSPEGHKVTNKQYVDVLTEKQKLEQQRDAAIGLIKAVIKWNTDYPSSRIYGYEQIKEIANEMDIIFEQCKCFMEQIKESEKNEIK